MGSEASSPDESSSSDSDDKEEPVVVPKLTLITSPTRKYRKRSFKDLRSPLDQPALVPHPPVTQTTTPKILHTSDRVPPIPSQAADVHQCTNTSSSDISQSTNFTRRPRGSSLDSDQRSKSTESEEAGIKEAPDIRIKTFVSTPSIRPSECPDASNTLRF